MPNRFTTTVKKIGAGTVPEKPLTVIIPVAGMGHRMKSYGPKCLLPANKKETILEKTISNIEREYPYCDIIVVAGFESEKVIKILPSKVRVVENHQYESTNIAESIRIGINAAANKHLLIVYGDLVFNVYSIRDITSDGPCAIVDSKERFKEDEVGVTVVDENITNFAYGLPRKWSQIAYFEGRSFDILKDLCSDKRKSKLYPFELFNIIINSGIVMKAKEPSGMLIKEIDSLKDL
jgi:choline kinase